MARKKRSKKLDSDMSSSFKWHRESTGHYSLWGEYVVEEKEIMAEVKKEKNKWKYCLWTWGTKSPERLEYSWETYKTAKEVKNVVTTLVIKGEPTIST